MTEAKQSLNKTNIFKGFKILIFFVLLITVLSSYARDIYTKFLNDATTFTRNTEQADNFHLPPVLVCMENGLKATVMEKYGLDTVRNFPGLETDFNTELSVWDIFVEASYILNRDFIIKSNDFDFNFSTGYNVIGPELMVHVSEYHTIYTGTCYQVDSGNLSISPPRSLSATLEFDESLNQDDIPPVCISIFIIHILIMSI